LDKAIGEYLLSPLLSKSLDLTAIFIDNADSDSPILTIVFPKRGNYSLWIGLYHLIDFFRKNVSGHARDHFERMNLHRGERVEIFGTVAEYVSYSSVVKLKFGDQGNPTVQIREANYPYINRTKRTRLNKLSLYYRKKREQKANVGPVSRLVYPESEALVNMDWLQSKVLIVAGRGEKAKTLNRLLNTDFYGGDLIELIKHEHLLIKPDLEDYKHISNQQNASKKDEFIQVLGALEEMLLESELVKTVRSLLELVENNQWQTQTFLSGLHRLETELEDDETRNLAIWLSNEHPGIESDVLENLRCVIINNPLILERYENTIQAIRDKGISVILIADFIPNGHESQILRSRIVESDHHIFSWNETNLNQNLNLEAIHDQDFLDEEEWDYAKSFAKQQIRIIGSRTNQLDSVHVKIQRAILDLEELPNFKKHYYYYFQPLVYSFKNGNRRWDLFDDFKDRFLDILEDARPSLPSNLSALFDEALSLMQNTINEKPFDRYNNYLIHRLKGETTFPSYTPELSTVLDAGNLKTVTFGGIPISEPINHRLLSTIVDKQPPIINILCWPKEASICRYQLNKKLFAKYFPDRIDEFGLLDLKLTSKAELDREKENRIAIVGEHHKFAESEFEYYERVAHLKYQQTSAAQDGSPDFSIKCNIIDLDQNRYFFLPLKSSVLAEKEDYSGEVTVGKCRFDDLFPGGRIFIYSWSRKDIRSLAKRNQKMRGFFDDLEHWKDALERAFESCDRDIDLLEARYQQANLDYGYGGNPERGNIGRWLHDESMLSPRRENLKIILKCDPQPGSLLHLDKVLEAYRHVRGFSQSMSSKLKKKLIERLNNSGSSTDDLITVTLNNVDVDVQSVKITALNREVVEVDYWNTGIIIDEYDYTE
jgi:hypothetical protein